MNKLFKGIGASDGIVISSAYLLVRPKFDINDQLVSNIDEEVKKYQNAIATTVQQLTKIKEIAVNKIGQDKAEVFDAHIQIANDPEISQEVIHTITNTKMNAANVANTIFDKHYETFKAMTDAYFRERAADVLDVKKRILSNLLNIPLPDIGDINREVILIAHDLTPSETALLDKKYVRAFITEIGGRTSHAAIMARTMEIPAVLGVTNILNEVKNDQPIGLNGDTGEIEIEPKDSSI
jgi:phosphotransferase system enzyme I (PtsI)